MKRALLLAFFLFAPFAQANHDTKELNCLAKNIYFEARGEGLKAMAAVGQVTRNRVGNDPFPDTYCNVVNQKSQFSWVKNKPKVDKQDEAWKQAQFIANYTYYIGWPYDLVKGSTYFHDRSIKPYWAKHMDKVTTIGSFTLYRQKS
jgi:N-acetylmuramoyl-L-alanine amidase